MHWKKTSLAALTALAICAAAVPALAVGDANGSLGTGGLLTGDISDEAGETDRVTIDLIAGAPLNVTFAPGFRATLAFSDPDGAPIDLGTTGPKVRLRNFPITRDGTYTFTITSSDGSQGRYTLSASQKFSRAVPVTGAGEVAIDVAMPAVGKIAATARRARGETGDPRILSLLDPAAAEMLPAAIEPVRHVVRLPATSVTAAGTYKLTVGPADGTSGWKALVRRIIPRSTPFRVSIANGINAVSFAEDGVGAFYKQTCAACHSWARSYAGVKGIASSSLSKMQAGSMPPGGRVPNEKISLVQSWIQTGRQP
jgi:hypothetical protein